MYAYATGNLVDDYVPDKARKLLIERAEAAWTKAIDQSHPHGKIKPKVGAYEAMCRARAAWDKILGNPGADEKVAKIEPEVIKKVVGPKRIIIRKALVK